MENYFEVYSYTLLDKRGNEIEMKEITKSEYVNLTQCDKFIIKKSWRTEYSDSTLYGHQYKCKSNG